MQTSINKKLITKELSKITPGTPAMDGDGVRITRMIGSPELETLDPFLLLDCFESVQPQDYIGGFPDHPHRGFETVTYLLAGRLRHKDSAGHEGVIGAGGVQWMTAGRGIIHSEMPEQEHGLLKGFQLWVNLPASAKMCAPVYQEFSADEVALERSIAGTEIRVMSGATNNGTTGPVINDHVHPLYLDVSLANEHVFEQAVTAGDNTFIYVIEGDLLIGERRNKLAERQLGVLGKGDQVVVSAIRTSRFLFASAQPLNEPVARGGPFVMNTKSEVLQAFQDFQNNTFPGD